MAEIQNSTTFREIPLSDEYCNSLIKVAQTMDTWNPENQTYHVSEHRKFLDKAGVPITQEQVDQCIKYWKIVRSDDLVDVPKLIDMLKVQHDPKLLVETLALVIDTDKDGLISAEEFQVGFEVLKIYDPNGFDKVKGIDFEQFLAEADTDGDHKVSVDEFSIWLEKQQ